MLITNDPWALAGHLNDVCVMSPIFAGEQLLGFTACVFLDALADEIISRTERSMRESIAEVPDAIQTSQMSFSVRAADYESAPGRLPGGAGC